MAKDVGTEPSATEGKKASKKKVGKYRNPWNPTKAEIDVAVKKVMGRPSKYTVAMPDSLITYAISSIKRGVLPFLSEWAREEAKVCSETALEWAKTYPDFSLAYKKVKDIQTEFLVRGGYPTWDRTMAIFTLKNISGWRDAQDLDITTGGESLGVVLLPAKDLQAARAKKEATDKK